MKKQFNDGWFFYESNLEEEFDIKSEKVLYSDYEYVEVPHDWLITETKKLYRNSEGWYKKTFSINTFKAKRYILEFEGIYMDSEIYINGKKIFEWKYGYTPLIIDISESITNGYNEIFVRVKNEHPNSRWYSGAGIYRNIWIYELGNIHIKPNDCYIHSELINSNNNEWRIYIDTIIQNKKGLSSTIELSHTVYGDEEREIATISESRKTSEVSTISLEIPINNPQLWSPSSPVLYKVKTILKSNDEEQCFIHKIGFREITIDPNEGMKLNGKSFKIHGVCQHHDLGALGSAVNSKAIERQLDILKEMGVNAIRTAHNPFSKEFYQLADEKGFLVQSEILDIWKHPKNTNDYARFFNEWIEKDIESWIKRERNFTSIFMWSIGNEIYDTHGREDGFETTQYLKELVLKYDYRKKAFITFGSNYMLWDKTHKSAEILDCIGYNYGETLYEKHHKENPNWIIYGSETGSFAQSRRVYHFPLSQSILADDDFQCSSLGNSQTSWGAKDVEKMILEDKKNSFSLGQFVWSGFDYIGEPTPYDTKSSFLGHIDTAGFPKDSYYIFKAGWTSYKDNPMIHIFPYWDFSEGQLIDIRVTSNAPKVELFFNNHSLGVRESRNQLIYNWQLKYEPGELLAVAYDEFDNIISETREGSFGNVKHLKLKTTDDALQANGTDLAFIEIVGEDLYGNEVKNANNRIHVKVEGPGRLLGIDNGDSTDYDSYKKNSKKLFNGKLLIMIGSTQNSGDIKVTISSKGLPDASLLLSSMSCPIIEGTALPKIVDVESNILPSVPVRKIELQAEYDAEKNILLKAKLLPENADYSNIKWRLTDSKGIDSDIATLESDGLIAKLIPKSNGKVYVRCGVFNDKPHMDFYSMLDFKFSGLKETDLNPYKPISGGKYTRSNVELTNGNERGVATLRGTESWVIFDNVNFQDSLAKQLTLSLFPLEDNPFDIEIWTGTPREEGSNLIDIVQYTKGSIWNTYQEQTFTLKEFLKGAQTISFVFRQKVHLKEFSFYPVLKATEVTSILNYDYLYGDSYTLKEEAIEKIGNNVVIGFENIDFKTENISKIAIMGYAPTNKNTVQVKIKQYDKEDKYMIDFDPTKEYQTRYIDLNKIYTGKIDLEYVFLPGSNFNLKEFKFISKKENLQ